jgi:paraquat-inducible protein B
MTDPGPPDLDVAPRRPMMGGLSVVWLVPILALAISLAIAWQSFSSRGVLVEITFADAAGVVAGETTLRYREVVVGVVEQVGFAPGLGQVVVGVRVDQDIAPYLDADAEFWVVRPEVTTRGISGLGTVLSGAFIAGAWDGVPGEARDRFEGRSDTPLFLPGQEGTRIVLTAPDGNLIGAGAPVFFRGIEVGRIETPELDEDGQSVRVEAFIRAPHDRRLTTGTRFWDMSGFSVSFGPDGLTLDVASLGALVSGGIAFDSFLADGTPIEPGTRFTLYSGEAEARQSLFTEAEGQRVEVMIVLDGSVSGLAAGAEVTFQGLRVGEVTALSAFLDAGTPPQPRVRAILALSPTRLGLPAGATPAATLEFLAASVESGLRARLGTANLFSSALRVDLVDLPDAKPATMDRDAVPFPQLPVIESDIPDVTATAEGALERINALPIEQLLEQAISLMASIEALARAEDTRRIPGAVTGLLDEGRALIGSDAVQALPADLRDATADLRGLLGDLRDGGLVENANAALGSARDAADAVAAATEGLPALAARLNGLVAAAEGLIETYGARSAFSDETLTTLRDLRDAARAVTSLARAIERAPNSLILGR